MRRFTIAFASLLVLLMGFTVSTSAQDIDCPGLSFEEAQAILAQDPNDPNGLDRDNDGVACENNASDGGSQSGDTDDTDDTETSELPSTGVGSSLTEADGQSAGLYLGLSMLLGGLAYISRSRVRA